MPILKVVTFRPLTTIEKLQKKDLLSCSKDRNKTSEWSIFQGRLYSIIFLILFLFISPLTAGAVNDKSCIPCHSGKTIGKNTDGTKEAPLTTRKDLTGSVHAGIGCTECHRDISNLPHEKTLLQVDCGICHKEAGHLFDKGMHGIAFKKRDKDAPSCISCHGTHRVLPVSDKKSPVYRENILLLCSKCHTDVDVQKTHGLPSDLIKAYEESVHGRLLKEGRSVRAAVCTDCHGSHMMLGRKERESNTNKINIAGVCGRCHVREYNEYKLSIHGKALQKGELESPGCTDCHGEHTLMVVKDPKAGVYVKNVPATCARCHENQEIIKKYRLPSDRYSSYMGSFHGVSMKYGNITVANCTSCHEVHHILPAADPESSVHSKNLNRTCGKCHPAMKGAVSLGKIHVEAEKESSRGMYYVRKFYTWFIGILMVLFVGYIILDIYGRLQRRKHGQQR
jgi:hypothetical protein